MSNTRVKEHLGAEVSRYCEFLPLYHQVATVTTVQFSYLLGTQAHIFIHYPVNRINLFLKPNVKKTKIMAPGPITSWQIEG